MRSIQESRDFVLEQAKGNIDFIKASPDNTERAKQINASLANIVAMERNVVMDKAIELSIKRNEPKCLPGLPEH